MNNKQKTASGGKKKGILIVLIILLLLAVGLFAGWKMLSMRRKEYALQMQSEAKRFYDRMNDYQFSSTHPMDDQELPLLPDKDFTAFSKADSDHLTIEPTDTAYSQLDLSWDEFGLKGSAPFGNEMYFVFRMENERVTQVIACERDILTEELLSRKPASNEVSLHDYFKKEYIAYYP